MRFADALVSHESMSRRFVVVPPPVLLLCRGAHPPPHLIAFSFSVIPVAAVIVVVVVVAVVIVLDRAIHHKQIHVVIRGIVPLGHSNPMSLTYSKLPFGVPRYTTFPSASSMSVSNAKNTTKLGWCMLVMIVFPHPMPGRGVSS
jgi:hypothetical protein